MTFQYKTSDSLVKVKFKAIFHILSDRRVHHPVADTNNTYISAAMYTINKEILVASPVIFKMFEFSVG